METTAAAEQRKAAEMFHRLIEFAPDAMVFVNEQGRIVVVNAQTERLFGYGREELLGQPIELLVPGRYRHPHAAHRAGYFGAPKVRPMGSGLDLFAVRKDGTEFPVEISLGPIETAEGLLVASAIRDITERKRLAEVEHRLMGEQAARAAAETAVRARDDFVAMAGHELKTPLTALLLQLQGLQRVVRGNPPTNVAERLEKAARSGWRMEQLINQLLDVSRITAGRLRFEAQPLDLAELVREVAGRFADASAHASSPISVRIEEEVEGNWDRPRIDQVLTNLLSNAIKYGQGKPVEVELSTDADSAVIRVIDHGIGIEREDQQKIFERFERAVTTRAYGGLGLGLWIARQIVEASGGTLHVDSAPSRGSTFTCRLPLRSEERPHAAP